MNNNVLEQVSNFPYLGLILDPELKFVEHRKATVNNVRSRLHQHIRVRGYVEDVVALDVYKTMVLPTLDYVDYIWDRDNLGENRELQLIQNKALRVIYNVKLGKNPEFNTVQLHKKGNCQELNTRRDMHLLFYAFSLAKNPNNVDNRNIPTRRHMGKRLVVPRSLKPIVLRSAFYRAVTRWNQLKALYTNIEDLSAFKISIKNNYDTCFM